MRAIVSRHFKRPLMRSRNAGCLDIYFHFSPQAVKPAFAAASMYQRTYRYIWCRDYACMMTLRAISIEHLPPATRKRLAKVNTKIEMMARSFTRKLRVYLHKATAGSASGPPAALCMYYSLTNIISSDAGRIKIMRFDTEGNYLDISQRHIIETRLRSYRLVDFKIMRQELPEILPKSSNCKLPHAY